MTANTRKPRWLWVVVGLLGLSVVAGSGLSKYNEYQSAKQQAAIRRIKAIGGDVHFRSDTTWYIPFPDWMWRWEITYSISRRMNHDVPNRILLRAVPINDEDLRNLHIADLPTVKMVWIASTKMTGRSFEEITKLPRLESLELNNIEIQDDDFGSCRKLPSLKSLDLSHARITNNGVENLTVLFPNLTDLKLDSTSITDDALRSLRRCKSLTYLNLRGTEITATGFHELHGIRSLRGVYLEGVKAANIDNMRELTSTLPDCQIIAFDDPSQPCSVCGKPALRELGTTYIDLETVFKFDFKTNLWEGEAPAEPISSRIYRLTARQEPRSPNLKTVS